MAMGSKLGGELLFSVAVVDAEGYVMVSKRDGAVEPSCYTLGAEVVAPFP